MGTAARVIDLAFIFVNHHFVIAVVGIIIFTIGEVFGSISKHLILQREYRKHIVAGIKTRTASPD